jgi:hypothetical protein
MKRKSVLDFLVDYQHTRYHPAGRTEKGQKWYPKDEEVVSCCAHVREPSHKCPWSLYKHCLSKKHIKTHLLENPSETERAALNMTVETAPLHVNDTGILLETAKFLLENAPEVS